MDARTKFGSLLKTLVRITPLISGLVSSRWRDHLAACRELIITLLFTTIPLWAGGWVNFLRTEGISCDTQNYLSYIQFGFDNGDLFLFSCSILAPIVYIAICEPFGSKEFPSKTSHTTCVILIVVLSTIAFGLRRAGLVLNQAIISKTSASLFIAASFLLYITLVYKSRITPDRPDEIKNDEREFANRYGEHR